MRLLVKCPHCRRQYRAGKRKAGTKFRCLCGELVLLGQPLGHSAAVVRCSSCGAPREKGSESCTHCRSDFTLHERDLHTVCPSCLARVSDRARYCHFCASSLAAELVAGEATQLHCPACKPRRKLISRRLGGYPLATLECPRCAGWWLGMAELDQLLEFEARQRSPAIARVPEVEEPPRSSGGYRPCVVCRELMSRRNFARGKSGVIVDLCRAHGVWFDANELARLIAWTRAGGLYEARRDLARVGGGPAGPFTVLSRDTEKARPPRHRAASSLFETGAARADDRDRAWIADAFDLAAHVLCLLRQR